MSIDKVEITNSQGNLLTLSLRDPSNGYVVRDIGGLGPVKADISASGFSTRDGQQYQGSSRGSRNLTFQLGYLPNEEEDETIWDLRSQLYQYFMTDTHVDIVFYMLNGLTINTDGRVETCEPSIFSKDPQMDISILCFEPDFIDQDLIQMHTTFTTADTVPSTIQVNGTVKTGLTSLKFTVGQVLTDFSIYHTTPSGELRTMLVSAPLEIGDVVELCTVPGQKSITYTRSSVTTSLMWAVSPQSQWVLLEPGVNQFYLNAATSNPSFVWVDFNNRYGGL